MTKPPGALRPRPVRGRSARRSALSALLAAFAALSGADRLAAQNGGAPVVAAAALAVEPPTVDGRLDEAVWASAPVLADFVQREPVEGRPVSERTEARVLYDADALYIGAWLYDGSPEQTVLGETRRDADLGDSDAFLVLLDTYLDRQNGFVFGTTPAGIEYDGQVTREGQGGGPPSRRQQAGSGAGFNLNWDGSWRVAVSRDSAGWYAELRIPFSTLRYAQGGPQTWGLNLARRIRRKNEEAFWSPVPRQHDLNRVSAAGTLTGIEAPARRVLTVTPYVLASGRKDYVAAGDTDFGAEIGGDAKVGLTPSLTLDLTVNTDFAQVEVDEEQINLTRFRLFFPEKRPFFLENAGTFAVGTAREAELFFSRRIGLAADGAPVPIQGGARVSGRVGGVTVGVLDIQTGGVDDVVPATNYGVIRLLRELPNRSRLGLIGVSRVSTDDAADRNFTYGVDGRLGLGDTFLLDGYLAGTATPGVDAPERAWSLGASYSSPDWGLGATVREVSEAFNPEVGFLPRAGYRFASGRVLRRMRFPTLSWFRELRPHVSYQEYRDPDGFLETGFWHVDSHFELADGAFFQLPALNWNLEGLKEPFEISPGVVIPPGSYTSFEWGFAYNTDLSARLSVEGRVDIGEFYTGSRRGGSADVNGRIGEAFVGTLRATWYDVRLPQGDFETALVGLKAAWSFTPRVYLQSLLQYNEQTRTLSGNVRFGWLHTAGTGLFIVYNDLEHTGDPRTTGLPRGALDRTLVVKLTRQLQLR